MCCIVVVARGTKDVLTLCASAQCSDFVLPSLWVAPRITFNKQNQNYEIATEKPVVRLITRETTTGVEYKNEVYN